MSTEAFVTGQLLSWARERSDLSVESAAQRLKMDPDKLEAWEKETARPTLRQAQALARTLHVPFGYLYLPAPPAERSQIPDLRTVGDELARMPSPELSDVLDDAIRKQHWYREHLEQEGAAPFSFVGSASVSDDPDAIAAELRQTIQIDGGLREEASSWEEFLRLLIQRVEESGVLVLRSGVVGNNVHRPLDVDEFRGFAISDDMAPLIFVNGQDAIGAQSFTLVHELAHIWIGRSGVSNPNYRMHASEQANEVEILCNRVAAETLVPSTELRERWKPGIALDDHIKPLTRYFRVSAIVVLRQAYDLGLIERPEFRTQYDILIASGRRIGSSGGNFYNTLVSRSSRMMTTALMAALAEGRVHRTEAARLLNVKVKTLGGIAEHVLEGTSVA